MEHDSHSTSAALRRMMRAGDTESVLQLLGESDDRQATMPAEHASLAGQQYRSGLIDAEAWSRAQLQLYQAVLDMLFTPDKKANCNPELLDKLQLRRLVDNHDIAPALHLCETLGDASILMQAQYEIGRKLFFAGAIGLETWELIQHKTMYLLWKLTEQAPDTQTRQESMWKSIGRFFKRR